MPTFYCRSVGRSVCGKKLNILNDFIEHTYQNYSCQDSYLDT